MELNEYGFSPFPDFFRIYNTYDHSHRLVIPKSYRKYCPDPLPKTVVLKKPEGKFWNVKWTISQDGTISFEGGWGKFVVDNGILEGDTVLFTYDGFRGFWVRVYRNGQLVKPGSPVTIEEISDDEDETSGDDDDHDMVKKEDNLENTITSLSSGSSDEDNDAEEDDDDDMAKKEDSLEKTITSLSLGSSDEDYDAEEDDDDEDEDAMIGQVKKPSNGSSIRGESSTSRRGRGPLIGDPETYLDDPNNPCFEASSSSRRVLVVAKQAIKDYGLNFKSTVNLDDGLGKLKRTIGVWKDRLVVNKWDEMYLRNEAKPGDSIICEILRKRGFVRTIKVHFIKQ